MMKLLHILNGENSTLLSNFDNKWDIKLLSEKHKEYLILTQDKYKVCQHIYHLLKKRETKYPALASIKIYAKDEPI